MQEVSIRKSLPDIQHQFDFFRTIENKIYVKSHRTAIRLLAGFTLVYIVLMLSTDSRTFVTLKAVASVLISLNLIGLSIYFLWVVFRLVRRNSSIEKVIQTKINEDSYYVSWRYNSLGVTKAKIRLTGNGM